MKNRYTITLKDKQIQIVSANSSNNRVYKFPYQDLKDKKYNFDIDNRGS